MNKSMLLTGLGCLAAAGACGQATAERPNVILLVADDLGYGDLSCYGAERVSTPRVDSIARGGVRFTDAHAVASTSTLLTGEYCFRRPDTNIAAGDAAMIIKPEQYTLADMFKSQGYTTAAIGKWHLGLGSVSGQQDWNGQLDTDLHDIGFDHYYVMAATADRVPCVFIENGRVRNYDPSAPIAVSYRQNFPGEPTGAANPELLTKLRPSPNHGHNQSIVNGISRIGFMKGGGKALWRDEDIADSIATGAIRFMKENTDRPFFMYLCTNDVHVPRYPHERFRGKSPMGLRGEAILQFDYTVGLIADALKRLGIADNTLLIITSDNGPALQGSTGDLRGGKYLAYEGGQKVPFMIRWGNNGGLFKAGSTYDESATLVDLFPTLVEMCGITGNGGTEKNYLPADRVIDGVSMVPVFTQNKVIHTADTPILHMKREKLKAIQYAIPTADILSREEYKDYDFDVLKNNEYVVFKYFKNIQNDNSAFFDKFRKNWLHILTDDAGENYNRTPAYPTIADEMRDRLDEKMNEFKNNRRGIIENS